MAFKQFPLSETLQVTVYKRRVSRNLRLTISAAGQIRVSIPRWAPYKAGVEFARSRLEWIESQLQPTELLTDGQSIGKAHRLKFVVDANKLTASSRISSTQIIVTYPGQLEIASAEVQAVATKAAIRALRQQAQQLLPQRLAQLANEHSFSYRSVAIKQLKGRWGSCDQQTNIILNLYLMQLPWELIDYVLTHELVHTQVMKHGPDFWQAMRAVLPASDSLRKRTRDYRPVLNSSGKTLMA